ncbi:MAG: alpha/beta fold hydrolase [Anaerolineales bacterium]|nr:alpha/beta fold hydrolase [Anaerolineales bacterium]
MTTYEKIGKGEPLLLLHGALLSRSMWQYQVASFGEIYQIIALDLPAHGETPDITGEYTITLLAENMIQMLDSLGVQQTHVCGHSLGGMVAQQLAASYPNRIRKLVLAETAFGTQNTLWERVQTSFARPFLKMTPQSLIVDLSVKKYSSLNQHVGEYIKQEMSRYDHKTSVRVMSAAFHFSGKAQLKNIQSPTLVLVAEDNKQTHSQGKELAQNIPNAKLKTISHANHMLNMDNPEDFNRVVLAFLQHEVS